MSVAILDSILKKKIMNGTKQKLQFSYELTQMMGGEPWNVSSCGNKHVNVLMGNWLRLGFRRNLLSESSS